MSLYEISLHPHEIRSVCQILYDHFENHAFLTLYCFDFPALTLSNLISSDCYSRYVHFIVSQRKKNENVYVVLSFNVSNLYDCCFFKASYALDVLRLFIMMH